MTKKTVNEEIICKTSEDIKFLIDKLHDYLKHYNLYLKPNNKFGSFIFINGTCDSNNAFTTNFQYSIDYEMAKHCNTDNTYMNKILNQIENYCNYLLKDMEQYTLWIDLRLFNWEKD